MTKMTHTAARLLLAKQRLMTSLLDKEIISQSDDLVFDKADWVPLYLDRGNCVTSDCGTMTAYRAATLKGDLLWMVFTPGKKKGYHGCENDPFDAMEQARRSWAGRRAVRQDWAEVKRTARNLVTGRETFDVRVEDLHASPLCNHGIEGFRAAVGLSRINRISGRMAALLMMVEPQMGFVIHAAKQRHAAQRGHAADQSAQMATA